MSDEDIIIQNYTDKSFVVRGDTKKYREYLKNLGGKWNSSLTDKETGEKFAGWIYPSIKKNDVKNWYDNRESLDLNHLSLTTSSIAIPSNASRLLSSIGLPHSFTETKTNSTSIEIMFKQIIKRLDVIEERLGITSSNKEISIKAVVKPENKTITKTSSKSEEDIIIEDDDEELEKVPIRRLLGKK